LGIIGFFKRILIISWAALYVSACSAPTVPDPTAFQFTQLFPAAGSVSGNEWITLTGSNVNQISSVKIGGVPCSPVVVVSSEQIQCKTGVYLDGAAKVDVTITANATKLVLKKAFSWQVFVGQTDGLSGKQAALGFYGPLQFKQCGTRYVATDANNRRVVIYNQFPTSVQTAPDLVLGQPSMAYVNDLANLNEDYVSSVASRRFAEPYGVACDANRLIVTDAALNRAFVWSSFPTSNNQGANLVLGQNNFTSVAPNAGGAGAGTFNIPTGVWLEGEKVIIADYANSRVLIWNSFPTSTGQPADIVVGQTSMTGVTANPGGMSEATFSRPISVTVANGKLIVADNANQRVLIFPNIPSVNHASASVVVGQPDFTSSSCSVNSYTTCGVVGVASDGVRLAVSDQSKHRVLVWNTMPTYNGQPASAVLGQTDFSSSLVPEVSATSVSDPYLMSYFSGKLAVADYSNNRIMMWNLSSLTTHAPADFIFGQANSTSASTNAAPIDGKTLQTPVTPWSDGTRLAVGDYEHHRILLWNTIPKTSNASADVVLGQADFTHGLANRSADPTPSPSATTINHPAALFGSGNRLLVSDSGNHRLLIWSSQPTSNGQAANLVLGQANFVSNEANRGGAATASTLNNPYGIWTNGTKLVVADLGNNRVLIWDTFPTVAGQAADRVLGQPDMSTSTPNTGGIDEYTMSNPAAVWVVGTKLIVSDNGNNRVLIWNTFPTYNDQPADLVLGQPFFTTLSANFGGISGATLKAPRDVWSDGVNLVIADEGNHRLLVWDQFPTVSHQAASRVVGQRGFLNSDYKVAPGSYPLVNGFYSNNGLWFTASRPVGVSRVTIGPAE
jgi:hypothetical protein